MDGKQYELRFLPLFEQDLNEIADYISLTLDNPQAAEKLVNDVEDAIYRRLECPEAFEPYPSKRRREYPYYRIFVKNFTIFYVVIGNTMEVRRILYGKRNWQEML